MGLSLAWSIAMAFKFAPARIRRMTLGRFHLDSAASKKQASETTQASRRDGAYARTLQAPAKGAALSASGCGKQGCLVLRYCGDFEHEIDVESGSPAGVSDVVTSRSPDQIIGEGAQARDDSGVLANAGGVVGKGGVAHIVTAILNAPMGAN